MLLLAALSLPKRLVVLTLIGATVLLGACTSEAPSQNEPEPSLPEATGNAIEPETTASEPAVTSTEPTLAPTNAAVALDSEGLRFVDGATGSASAIAFGTPSDQVIAALMPLRSEPTDTGENTECGAGPLTYATWDDGLTLYGSDGEFGGWAVNGYGSPDASSYQTMAGIGVGSTRSELEAAYTVEFFESSLGAEFAAGDLYGLLSDSTPSATVTNLWSGLSCNFR